MNRMVSWLTTLIVQYDDSSIAAVQFKIKLFKFFSTCLNSSLIIFIRLNTVNYRNALDRLRIRMNIILFIKCSHWLMKS